MKKILWTILFINLFVLMSCNEEKENKEPFSQILKEDTSRIPELLKEADSIRESQSDFYKKHQKLSDSTIKGLRIKKIDKILVEDEYPRIKILNQDLIAIMEEPKSKKYVLDTLVFTLAMLHNHREDSIYREESNTNYPDTGPYGLTGRPILLVHSKVTHGNE